MKAKNLNFKNGIFDIEGTLIDNQRLYRWLAPKISLALDPNFSELSLPTAGLPLPNWSKFFHRSKTLTNFVLVFERKILKLLDLLDKKEPQLFDGAKEVLLKLRENGIFLFATTGSNQNKAISMLKKAGVLEFFTLVAGSELPKKEHFKLFAQRLNLSPEDFFKETFLVSDGPVDLNLASKRGIYPIGIANTFRPEYLLRAGAKDVISNLKQLIQ